MPKFTHASLSTSGTEAIGPGEAIHIVVGLLTEHPFEELSVSEQLAVAQVYALNGVDQHLLDIIDIIEAS